VVVQTRCPLCGRKWKAENQRFLLFPAFPPGSLPADLTRGLAGGVDVAAGGWCSASRAGSHSPVSGVSRPLCIHQRTWFIRAFASLLWSSSPSFKSWANEALKASVGLRGALMMALASCIMRRLASSTGLNCLLRPDGLTWGGEDWLVVVLLAGGTCCRPLGPASSWLPLTPASSWLPLTPASSWLPLTPASSWLTDT
jgi:hypothetical protein